MCKLKFQAVGKLLILLIALNSVCLGGVFFSDLDPNTTNFLDGGSPSNEWRDWFLSRNLDLGTNIITDGSMSGDWIFNSGDLSDIGDLSADTLTITDPTNNYKLLARDGHLAFQNQSAGSAGRFNFFTLDGDGTDNNLLIVYAEGTPADVSNKASLEIGFNQANNQFRIQTDNAGTGTEYPISIFTNGNTDQMVLGIDNNVTFTGTVQAEQLTSTDDITMQGHLLTMGDIGAATDTVMGFLGSTNSATIIYDQSADLFNFGDAGINTTGTADLDTITGNSIAIDTGVTNMLFRVLNGITTIQWSSEEPGGRPFEIIDEDTNILDTFMDTSGRFYIGSSLRVGSEVAPGVTLDVTGETKITGSNQASDSTDAIDFLVAVGGAGGPSDGEGGEAGGGSDGFITAGVGGDGSDGINGRGGHLFLDGGNEGSGGNDNVGGNLYLRPGLGASSDGFVYMGDRGVANYIQISRTGDQVFVGGAGLPFGSFKGDEIGFVTAGGTGSYTEISDADITVGYINLTTFQNNKEIAVENAGVYKVSWYMSAKATGANKHIVGGVGVDVGGAGALTIQDGQNHAVSTGNAEFPLSGVLLLDLSANSEVGLMVTNETDNTNVTVEHAGLVITMVGGT